MIRRDDGGVNAVQYRVKGNESLLVLPKNWSRFASPVKFKESTFDRGDDLLYPRFPHALRACNLSCHTLTDALLEHL